MTRIQFELVPRVCAVEQLLELDVSALGFPLPSFGGFSVLCCLDNVPPVVLQVRSAAAPGAGSEGTGFQLGTVWQSKQFGVNIRGD